jgi:hypothetical protein
VIFALKGRNPLTIAYPLSPRKKIEPSLGEKEDRTTRESHLG